MNDIEQHPWPPYIPPEARILIMGTFPPAEKRWAMRFYYPNPSNDFWKMMGLIYYNDKAALMNSDLKTYNLEKIKSLLDAEGIAMNDTGYKVRRLMGNASDKYLEIVEPVDLDSLMRQMPHLTAIITTGEKAAAVIASLTGTEAPKMGESVMYGDIKIWRMPSTSRAYPLALEKKADYYRRALI